MGRQERPAKPERPDNENKARGRANADGQNRERTFVHQDTGEEVTGTMNDYHEHLHAFGYRPKDDEADETPDTEPAPEAPATEPTA